MSNRIVSEVNHPFVEDLIISQNQWQQLLEHGKLFFNDFDVYCIDVLTPVEKFVVICKQYGDRDVTYIQKVKEII